MIKNWIVYNTSFTFLFMTYDAAIEKLAVSKRLTTRTVLSACAMRNRAHTMKMKVKMALRIQRVSNGDETDLRQRGIILTCRNTTCAQSVCRLMV